MAVGDKVDAQNRNGVWWKGEVVEVMRHDVVVHFDGWDKLHDGFVPKRSDMIAPYDTKTEGVDTRGTITADAEFEVSEESLKPYVEKINSIISGEASSAEAVSAEVRPQCCDGGESAPRTFCLLRRRCTPTPPHPLPLPILAHLFRRSCSFAATSVTAWPRCFPLACLRRFIPL